MTGRGADAALPDGEQAPEAETRALLKELKEGTVVDGKYEIDSVLGRGAMGVVVAATHLQLKEKVALKFLYARADTGADFRARFRREAQVSAKLKNEHITRVLDIGTWREQAMFMVMEHLAGTDLRQVTRNFGALPVDRAIDYIVQVCEGMAEAHAHGIVHRDLKPSNLFVTKRPDGTDLVKVLDFGISKWSAQEGQLDDLTQTGVVLGSPKYMAPEQLFGSATVDPRADVWSIGAIFYELLVGKPPFDFPTLTRICAELSSDRPPPSMRALRPDLPAALEQVVMRCLERDPEKRIANVAVLAGEALTAVKAPLATAVRAKIQATLDATTSRALISTATGSLALSSGAFGSMSHGSVGASARERDAALAGTAARSRTARALLIAVAVLAIAVIGVALYVRRSPETIAAPIPSTASSPSLGSALVVPPPVPAPTASTLAPSASAPTSTAAPSTPSHAPQPTWPATPRPRPTPRQPPTWAPAETVAPTPPPAPAPPPTPAPPPQPKVDPLHDRQ